MSKICVRFGLLLWAFLFFGEQAFANPVFQFENGSSIYLDGKVLFFQDHKKSAARQLLHVPVQNMLTFYINYLNGSASSAEIPEDRFPWLNRNKGNFAVVQVGAILHVYDDQGSGMSLNLDTLFKGNSLSTIPKVNYLGELVVDNRRYLSLAVKTASSPDKYRAVYVDATLHLVLGFESQGYKSFASEGSARKAIQSALDSAKSKTANDPQKSNVDSRGRWPAPKLDEIKVTGDSKHPGQVDLRTYVLSFSKLLNPELDSFNPQFTSEQEFYVNKMRRSLNKRQSASVVLTAEPGAGKTWLLKTFAKLCGEGHYEDVTPDTEFLYIRASDFEAGNENRGDTEARISALIKYASNRRVILFIDEIHTLFGVGKSKGRDAGFFDMIKDNAADGSLRIVGATTHDEYDENFKVDEAASRRFPELRMQSPSQQQVLKVLKSWHLSYGLDPLPDAVYEQVLQLADMYSSGSALMDRATRLLDEVYSEISIAAYKNGHLTPVLIERMAAEAFGLQNLFFNPESSQLVLAKIEEKLKSRIQGNAQFVERVLQDTRKFLSRANDRSRPNGRYIVVAPKGAGKTTFAHAYADGLGVPVVRIALNTVESVSDLRARVIAGLSKNIFSVFLFDEAEKAHPLIQQALLDILDSNKITGLRSLTNDPHGPKRLVTYTTSNTTMFLASNAGQSLLSKISQGKKKSMGFGASTDEGASGYTTNDVIAAVEETLDPAVLDRGVLVVMQNAKTVEEYKEGLRKNLLRLVEGRSQQLGQKFQLTDQQMDSIIDHVTSTHFQPGVSLRAGVDALDMIVGDVLMNPSVKVAEHLPSSATSKSSSSARGCSRTIIGVDL